MKNLLKKSLLTTASLLTVASFTQDANAQTAAVTATAEVSNQLTLAVPTNLNFGEFVAVGGNGGGNNARVLIAADGTMTVATDGTPAVTAIVDDTNAAAAQITIADGANAAVINVDINVTQDPTNGTDTLDFVQTAFTVSRNGQAATTEDAATPFTFTFDNTFNGAVNTLDIGGVLETQAAEAAYSDGTYNGDFDVVFSY